MTKMPIGSAEMRTSGNFAVVHWNYNSTVTLTSTSRATDPISKVDRIGVVNKTRTKISVPCPKAVSVNNRFIGGVHRFDEDIHGQRVAFKVKNGGFVCLHLDWMQLATILGRYIRLEEVQK